MRDEVFVEDVKRYRVPDVAALVAIGADICDRCEEWHVLERLRVSADFAGVSSELLATLHARITAITTDGDTGEEVYTVCGFGRDGEAFSFDIAARKFWQHKAFTRAINNSVNAGTFIMPGKTAATIRAIFQLSFSEEVN